MESAFLIPIYLFNVVKQNKQRIKFGKPELYQPEAFSSVINYFFTQQMSLFELLLNNYLNKYAWRVLCLCMMIVSADAVSATRSQT